MSAELDKSAVPRVSVLMTIYNAAPYLRRSIDSIVGQSFADWELIAVENGSTDGSAEILSSYADSRIRVFRLDSNIGRTPALRYAFERARGEYIAVLDADDVAHRERLAKQVAYLDSHQEAVLLGTWTTQIDENDAVVGEYTPPADPKKLLSTFAGENPIVHSSAMYRAAIASMVGGYPIERPHSQDYGLWLKLIERGAPAILPEHLCQFRIMSSGMTQGGAYRVALARDRLHLLIQAGKQLPLSKQGRRKNREEIAIARIRYATALARSGRVIGATVAACLALIKEPDGLFNNRITRGFFP